MEPIGFDRENPNKKLDHLSGCHREVWFDFTMLENNRTVSLEPFRRTLLKNRKESCYFVQYQEGMTFKAANDLQRLQYETRNLRRSYRFTLIGLFIAAGGLAINAAFEIISFFSK